MSARLNARNKWPNLSRVCKTGYLTGSLGNNLA
uniref:Uncharacterized protein n=1 Tax=Arundo donax TaxID=35708 RepID=A0A0A9BTI8_ARUDO